MSFGGGKSKSNQSSQQASNSVGLNTSVASGQSGNFNVAQNLGRTWNQAANQGRSFVDTSQQPFLSQLYDQAMKTFQAQPNQVSAAQKLVNPLLGQAKTAYGNLIGLSDPTKQIAAQEASLKSGLSDLFGQGKIGVDAAATNADAFGGSRHGLETAALGGEIAKAFAQGRGDIVANANSTAVNAAGYAAPMAGQLAQLGLAPEALRFSGLQGLQGLLGAPTVLQSNAGTSSGGSFDTGSSFGGGKASNFARSLGIDLSQAASSSSGSGSGFDFKMGFI